MTVVNFKLHSRRIFVSIVPPLQLIIHCNKVLYTLWRTTELEEEGAGNWGEGGWSMEGGGASDKYNRIWYL